jgi:putative glutathione S-transferase
MSATQQPGFHKGQATAKSALEEMGEKGEFKRTDATYRNHIEKGSRFEPEAGRYHLYIAYGCPWACRCLAARNLKGLQDAIGLSVTHPTWQRTRPDSPDDQHAGWAFFKRGDPPVHSPNGSGSFPTDGCIPDTVNNAKFVRDLYDMADDTTGKYTVPVLWDKKEKTIVNNESSEVLRMFSSAFNDVAKNPDLDLYPEDLRPQIDEVNSWVYPKFNNGVYRAGFATKQEAYEEAFSDVFEALDKMEDILSKQRYLVGSRFTEADIRAFVTLIRFDEVYAVYFKCNKKLIREYPNLKNYVREIYQMPGMADSVNIPHIKMHYYTSHPKLNHYAIIPKGVDVPGGRWWDEPHDRDRFSKPKADA